MSTQSNNTNLNAGVSFGGRVKTLRDLRGFSRSDLASQAKLPGGKGTIAAIERNAYFPSRNSVLDLEIALGAPQNSLVLLCESSRSEPAFQRVQIQFPITQITSDWLKNNKPAHLSYREFASQLLTEPSERTNHRR